MIDGLTSRIQVAEDGCWLWTGFVTSQGYGQFRHQQAHRLMYEAVAGEIPDGMVLDHLCGTRRCVNPRHLEPVTNQVNVWRGVALVNRGVCKSGRHDVAEVGVFVDSDGHHRCRECRRESKARYRARAAA